MTRKKKLNKVFHGSCKGNQLFIKEGIPYCASKENPKSKKYDINPCALSNCYNYLSEKEDELTELQKRILELIEKGESEDYIISNAPCSKTYYFKMKKYYNTKKEKLKIENVNNIIDKEPQIMEQTKENLQIIENQTINDSVQNNQIHEKQTDYKPIKYPEIKLCLWDFIIDNDIRPAVKRILDNVYRLTQYNIKEINEWLMSYSPIYPYPEWAKWLDKLIQLWEESRRPMSTRELAPYNSILFATPQKDIYSKNLTSKEAFQRYETEIPKELQREAYDVVKTIDQLIPVFEVIEQKIKEELNIETEFQQLLKEFKKGTLEDIGKIRLMTKILTNKNYSSYTPYIQLLEEIKNSRIR